jgi:hypothetical protein
MASKVSICNLALARIGQRKIQALTEQSPEGVACNDLYDVVRRIVLAYHPWRFAVKNQTLAAIAGTVAGQKYGYAYQLPADVIRVVCIEPVSTVPAIEFEVVGETLRTDDPTGEIRYIWDVEDPNRFDTLFINCFAYHLAADLAPLITGRPDQQAGMLNAFSVTLRAAAGISGGEARQPSRLGQDIRNSRK